MLTVPDPQSETIDPYRVLFPLGVLAGIWGAALWVMFGFGLSLNYPGTAHPDIMVGGFLMAFASGFLMTAIPRFTGTFPARLWEIGLSSTFIFLGLVSNMFLFWLADYRFLELSCAALNLLVLIFFASARFRKRKHAPPPFFLFVGVGLILGLAGVVFSLLSELELADLGLLGRTLYYQGFMLALLLGVGSKLVPALLGWSVNPIVELTVKGEAKKLSLTSMTVPFILVLLFLASFICDFFNLNAGKLLRAGVTTFVAVFFWRVYMTAPTRGVLSFSLRVAGIFLVAGLWGHGLSTSYALHFVHLAFIGGFTLFTILIATRVTLSHGGYGTSLENASKSLQLSGVLLIIAAIVRLFSGTGSNYVQYLAASAVLWTFALVIWSIVFIPKMIQIRPVRP